MSLTTDDLRDALAEAADARYDAAGAARLLGVRTRVRRARQRRAAAVSGLGALAVVAVAGAMAFGGSGTTTPAPASSTSAGPTKAAVSAPDLPTTWGPRDVVGAVTGSGRDKPARLITWPRQATGVLVRCDHEKSYVEITFQPVDKGVSTMGFSCMPGGEALELSELSPAAASIRPGQRVRVQVGLTHGDAPESTTFGVGLLVGRDEVDLSALREAPAGWTSAGAYAMADGWQYSAFTPDGQPAGTRITNGVQIALADQRAVRLQVRCSGAVRLTVDPGSSGEPTSVTCPVGRRSSQSVELDLSPGKEQRLSLRAVDSEPGALVEVGVSTR